MNHKLLLILVPLLLVTVGCNREEPKETPAATLQPAAEGGTTSDPLDGAAAMVLPAILPSLIPEIPEIPGLPGLPGVPEPPPIPPLPGG